MTGLPPYERFRTSKLAWAPELPTHWSESTIGRVATVYAGGTPDRGNPSYWDGGTIPWLNSGSVNEWVVTKPSEFITPLALAGSSTRWIPPRSIVIALAGQGRTKGMAARVELRTTLNQSLAAIVPTSAIEYRFLQYWLTANYASIRNLAGGDLRDGLNLQHIKSVGVPLPTISEQRAIADFLDRETAEIDAFVRDQEELIRLLEERRAATISDSITNGLNPNAPMKDSGVDWIGPMPEHWDLSQIRRLTQVRRGASPRPIDDPRYFDPDGEWAWVRIQDVSASDGALLATTQRLSSLGASLSVKLEPGSLFLSIAGSVGKACIAGIRCCIHDGFVYFPGLERSQIPFLYRIFELGDCFSGLGKLGTQLNLNTDTVAGIRVPLPPPSELETILAYLNKELAEIDASINDARKVISLLQERRGALISAAVTGNIDVRKHLGKA